MSAPDDEPGQNDDLAIRMLRSVRRDVQEMNERESRVIELVGRMNLRLDDLVTRMDRGFNEIRSDIVQLENRALTAITEVRLAVERIDEHEGQLHALRRQLEGKEVQVAGAE